MLNRAGFAMVAAAMVLAFAPVTAQAQTCGEIELGAAVSATGIYAANGTNTKNGYEFAIKKINDAGGVKIGGKCYHFKVKYYDDEFDAGARGAAGRAPDRSGQDQATCSAPTARR